MKQQTFIAILENKDHKQVTFERFACKKAETVKAQMERLFKSSLYMACIKGAVSVAIYATPDGYTREVNPCLCFNIR